MDLMLAWKVKEISRGYSDCVKAVVGIILIQLVEI